VASNVQDETGSLLPTTTLTNVSCANTGGTGTNVFVIVHVTSFTSVVPIVIVWPFTVALVQTQSEGVYPDGPPDSDRV